MEREFSEQLPHHRSDDDGGFCSNPRPVSLPLHGRAPYADDWGSAPSSDNSEHIPRTQAGQGSYPRQRQHQQPPQQVEPVNNRHIPDQAFKHNGDVQDRSTRNVDPRCTRSHSSQYGFKPDPRYPGEASMHHPGYPGPGSRDGREPQQSRGDQRYFPDPGYPEQQKTQRQAAAYPDRNGGFTGGSPPRAPVGHPDRTAPMQQQETRPVRGGLGSPRMQQDDRTPLREMSDNRLGGERDQVYPGDAKQRRQDGGQRRAPPTTHGDWLSQNVDPASRRQNRNLGQPTGQYPGRPSASLPNHYMRPTVPAGQKHNTFNARDRRDDPRPPGGSARSPDGESSRLHTNRSPMSDGSSSYSSRSNQGRGREPVKKSLFGDQPPGGSTHQSPRSQQQSGRGDPRLGDPRHDDPRRYFEPLTIQTGPIYENLNQMPPQITVSDVTPAETPSSPHSESPMRPPLPAALRDDYIRELAKSRSPHTRQDMLNASQLSHQRQHEPLIFKYPTTSQVRHLHHTITSQVRHLHHTITSQVRCDICIIQLLHR